MKNNAQIPFHDIPADQLIAKLEVIKHKSTLNEDEAALFLNLTMNAIRALRRKRKIGYCKSGDRIQYDMDELVRYKNKHTIHAFGTLSSAMA